jgi:hypothetical protein
MNVMFSTVAVEGHAGLTQRAFEMLGTLTHANSISQEVGLTRHREMHRNASAFPIISAIRPRRLICAL